MIVESSSRPPKIISCPHFGDASPGLKNRGLLTDLLNTQFRGDIHVSPHSKCQIMTSPPTNIQLWGENNGVALTLSPQPNNSVAPTDIWLWGDNGVAATLSPQPNNGVAPTDIWLWAGKMASPQRFLAVGRKKVASPRSFWLRGRK